MKELPRERLIRMYGKRALSKACAWFEKRGRHFIIEELEAKIKELKTKKDAGN